MPKVNYLIQINELLFSDIFLQWVVALFTIWFILTKKSTLLTLSSRSESSKNKWLRWTSSRTQGIVRALERILTKTSGWWRCYRATDGLQQRSLPSRIKFRYGSTSVKAELLLIRSSLFSMNVLWACLSCKLLFHLIAVFTFLFICVYLFICFHCHMDIYLL